MSGGTYCQFRVGGTGRSSNHMMYISRESAVIDKEKDVVMRNLPEDVKDARDYKELRTNLASYAWAREESEQARFKGAGEVRTHYRCTVSFEKNVDTEKAKEMVNQWLEKEFPQAKAVAFIHRDTDHQHAHIWIDARKTDGKKIDLSKQQYKRLDETWNRIYSKEMGRDHKEHLQKKEQTREHKAAYVRGEKSDKPERIYKNNREIYQEREQRNTGVKQSHDKSRDGRSQPNLTDRNKELKTQEPRLREVQAGAREAEGRTNTKLPPSEARKGEIGKQTIERSEGETAISKYTEASDRAGEQFNKTKQTARDFSDRENQANQQLSRTESASRTTIREAEILRDELKELGKELSKEIDKDRYRCR